MVETLKNKLKTVRISCFPVAWSLRVSVPDQLTIEIKLNEIISVWTPIIFVKTPIFQAFSEL